MKNLFVPYKLAVIAKKKGFDEPCLAFFNDGSNFIELFKSYEDLIPTDKSRDNPIENINRFIKAPLYQQIIDWFREKHNLHFHLCFIDGIWNVDIYDISKEYGLKNYPLSIQEILYYKALNKAIEEAFKLI